MQANDSLLPSSWGRPSVASANAGGTGHWREGAETVVHRTTHLDTLRLPPTEVRGAPVGGDDDSRTIWVSVSEYLGSHQPSDEFLRLNSNSSCLLRAYPGWCQWQPALKTNTEQWDSLRLVSLGPKSSNTQSAVLGGKNVVVYSQGL